MTLSFFLSALGLFSFSGDLRAAEKANEQAWGLLKILDYATEHSPQLRAGAKDIQSAGLEAKQAGRWDNPVLSFSAGKVSITPDNGSVLSATLMQSVPIFGQRSIARELGEKQAEIAELDSARLKLALRHEVVVLSYRLASIQEQFNHLSHRKERLSLLTRYLRTRPFASPSLAVEKNLIENRMREIEEKFTQIVAEREGAWQDLNAFLGLPSLIIPRVPWEEDTSVPNQKELLANLKDANPELLRQARIIEATNLAATHAGKLSYPDLRLGGGFSDQKVATSRERSYMGTIELSLPLWNRGQDGVSAAKAKTEAEYLRSEQKERELLAQFSKAWTEMTEARKRIDLFPESLIPKLEAQMQSAEANWKKGLVTASALLELETQVHDQAVKVYEAHTDFVRSLAQVLLFAGKDVQVSAGK